MQWKETQKLAVALPESVEEMYCFQFCILSLALYGYLPGYSGAVNNEVINMTSNLTFNGSSCHSDVEFNCTSEQVKVLIWKLGEDELISLQSFDTSKTIDLCTERNKSDHNTISLNNLCNNGGSLWIKAFLRYNGIFKKHLYDINSKLIAGGMFLSNFSQVYCGGSIEYESKDLTNLTLSCYPENITLSSNNTSINDTICEGTVELTCTGTNVKYFLWMYNKDQSLTSNVTILENNITTNLDVIVCTINKLKRTVNNNFDFESTCVGDLNEIKELNVSNISCSSNAGFKDVEISCNFSATTDSTIPPTTSSFPTSAPSSTLSPTSFPTSFPSSSPTSSPSSSPSFWNRFPFCNNTICDVESFATVFGGPLAVVLSCFCCGWCCIPYISVTQKNVKKYMRRRKLKSVVESDCYSSSSDSGENYNQLQKNWLCWKNRTTLFCYIFSMLFYKLHFRQKGYQYTEVEIIEERAEERVHQEVTDRGTATNFSAKLFSIYKFQILQDLGSRLQKYWFLRRSLEFAQPDMLQMTMKQSTVCQLELGKKEISVLKGVLKCLKNPLLLTVEDLEVEDNMISVIVEYVPNGSIRDIMHKATPSDDWATKYARDGNAEIRNDEEIATCGRHILEALLLLYEQGFPIIGQIHSGNVFKIGDRYVLGGYENTLLGYRTYLFSKFCEENLLDHMDEIMFGLLLYEMATGCQGNEVLLDQLDCHNIRNSELRGVLQVLSSYSFRRIEGKEKRIQKILEHPFFSNVKSFEKKECFEYTPEGLRLVQYLSSFSKRKFSVNELFLKIDDVLGHLKGRYRVHPDTCYKIGWRNNKTWAKVENTMLSAIEIPYTCPIFVKSDLETIRRIMKLQCTYLLEVNDVQYVKVNDSHVIILMQRFVEKGSLKDIIYRQSTPLQSWDVKYSTQQSPQFSPDQIASIGSQVLSVACKLRLFLGSINDPLPLSFIHSGNVFWDGTYCRMGGLENKLLGCRPRDYVKYRNHLDHIDEVMFGNFIFELVTGKELVGALPTDSEYNCLNPSFRRLLKKIFDNMTTLEEMQHLDFFQNHPSESIHLEEFNDRDVMLCLEKVQKGKHRNQDNEMEKVKYNFFTKPWSKFRNYFSGGTSKDTNAATGTSSEHEIV